MYYAILTSILCVYVSMAIHYVVLHRLKRYLRDRKLRQGREMGLVLSSIFASHIVQVLFYAAGYYLLLYLYAGSLEGEWGGGLVDYFYFSIVSFTSQGLGDIYPLGPIRILSGIEALNGLLLITWSATFTFMIMRDHWR